MDYQNKRLKAAAPHQNAIWEQGVNELNVIRREGKYITLVDGRRLTEFVSCSYLGLDQRDELREAAHATIEQFGVQVSVARTRIRASIFGDLDDLLEQVFDGRKTVTFISVSAVHMGLLPILASGELPGYKIAEGGPAFIMDKSAHASLQALRGIMEQFGPLERVDFQNFAEVDSIARAFAKAGKTIITISDSVGSMGGAVDIQAISNLVDELAGFAYLDDAHGTTVFGKRGQGFVFERLGQLSDRIILVGSLSKAFGATGGFLALSNAKAADFIKRYAIPYAFGGPPSMPGVGAAVASAKLHLNGTVDALQAQLRENTALFDSLLNRKCINLGSTMPIRGILIYDEFEAIRATRTLHEKGYAVTAAMYPTVALGRAMLRVAISASHTSDDVRGIVEAINQNLEIPRVASDTSIPPNFAFQL